MIDELRPMSLSTAARLLGLDPLEVVRLQVVFEKDTTSLELTPEDIDDLRDAAGIESWWEQATLPNDDNPARAAVRGALHQLNFRVLVGEVTTRLDNLWRGLSSDQQVAIEQAVMVLLEEGVLLTSASERGVQVSIKPGAEDVVEGIATGRSEPEGLAAMWQGA